MPYFNPINYASGLLDELEGAERAGRSETASEVRAELAEAAKALDAVDPQRLDEGGPELLKAIRARLADVLGGGSKPRTAKATAAPEKAVPPAAK